MIVKYKNCEYDFSDWQGYNLGLICVNQKMIYPDFVRVGFSYGCFETLIIIKCISLPSLYINSENSIDPKNCVWQLKSDSEFKFIIPIYDKMYGNLIHYKDLDLAKSRIDNLLLKINDLKVYI